MQKAAGEKTRAEAIESHRSAQPDPFDNGVYLHSTVRSSFDGHAAGPFQDQLKHNHPASPSASPSSSEPHHHTDRVSAQQQYQEPETPASQDLSASPQSANSRKTRANAPLTLQLNAASATAARSPTASTRLKAYNESPRGQPATPSSPAHHQQGTVPPKQQALHNPSVTFTPGSPKEGANGYFTSDHRLEQQQEQDRHYCIGDHHHPYTPSGTRQGTSPEEPSIFSRAKSAVASVLMVASPRLPFYSARDEDSHTTNNNTNDASGPFTPHGPYSPSLSKQQHGNTPSLAVSGPSGLFAAAPTSASSSRGLFSPSLHTPGFGSTSLSANAANTPGGSRGHNQKRSFYKDKGDSLYPASGSSYDSGFRKGPGHHAPGKASVFRVPRSITRLASRRSRVLPAIIVCSILFFYALGSTRRSSLYDAAQAASSRQVGRFFEAADARVGHLNPMKWALEKSGEAAHQQRVFSGTDGGIVEKFDVELLDPAGPLAEKGKVGSAEKRYASWEGGRRDSRMIVEEGKPHPIPKLMARAKQRWHALKNRQSKTFAEAVS